MIFWDTSAVVPLLVIEPISPDVRKVAQADPHILVWWGTAVECLSAIARREREGVLSRAAADQSRRVLEQLRKAWHEVLPSETVRDHAIHLLLRHPLRAADALQLGAALTWTGGRPGRYSFCALDARLAEAARGEGFQLPLATPTAP